MARVQLLLHIFTWTKALYRHRLEQSNTCFHPSFNLQAICTLAGWLTMVPMLLVALHWYTPSSGRSVRVWMIFVKDSEPFVRIDLKGRRFGHKQEKGMFSQLRGSCGPFSERNTLCTGIWWELWWSPGPGPTVWGHFHRYRIDPFFRHHPNYSPCFTEVCFLIRFP